MKYMLAIIPFSVNTHFSNIIVLIMGHNKKLMDSKELFLFEYSNKKNEKFNAQNTNFEKMLIDG
jgi:hypothetical protein